MSSHDYPDDTKYWILLRETYLRLPDGKLKNCVFTDYLSYNGGREASMDYAFRKHGIYPDGIDMSSMQEAAEEYEEAMAAQELLMQD